MSTLAVVLEILASLGRRCERAGIRSGLLLVLTVAVLTLSGQQANSPADGSAQTNSAQYALASYRKELDAFRHEFGGTRSMPAVAFYQFGMGGRAKLLFKDGVLRDSVKGTTLHQWKAASVCIVPSAYLVSLTTAEGAQVRIFEDEEAVWIEGEGQKQALEGTGHPLKLPSFQGHRYGQVLRVLHHEILMNVIDGRPVPNFYVYHKPWYRDGAMMAMCLSKTGNLDLIREWVRGLTEVFDHNNGGESEADNPGQVLFLISLVLDKSHPLVPKVLDALKALEVKGDEGVYIKGRSDFAEHPVYQTKWAKLGLGALRLPDPYVIPAVRDSYSSLFWMAYRERHVPGGEATDRKNYPYLGWATDHFQGRKQSPISDQDYPLTWETQASQADYTGMALIDPIFVTQKTSVPHTWHAAEVFLYLLERADRLDR